MSTRASVLTVVTAVTLSGGVAYFVGRAAGRCAARGREPTVAPTFIVRDGSTLLPPSAVTAADIAEFRKWSEKEELRQKWILVSQAVVLAKFGTPSDITAIDDNGIEIWRYQVAPDEVSFFFTRGRLTLVSARIEKRQEGD